MQHSLRVYKNERVRELLAADRQRNEREELELRMSTVPIRSKEFPVEEGKVKYPTPSNYAGNPLYRTSNMTYGSALPTHYEIPSIRSCFADLGR